MEKKRERSVNFTREETERLVSLVQENTQIIENRKSDAFTWLEKENTWKAIETSFNSSNRVVFRDAKHLKLKYEAMKRDIRKKFVMRAELYKSGGGTSHVSTLTPIEEKVWEILLSVEGSESIYDPDQVNTTDVSNKFIEIQSTLNVTMEDEPPLKKIYEEPIIQQKSKEEANSTNLPSTSSQGTQTRGSHNKWKVWNLSSLKSKNHTALCEPKEKRSFDKLSETKMEIVLLQKQLLEEEIQQRLIQKQMCQEELEFKKQMHELEKEHVLLKIEVLKTVLQKAKEKSDKK